MFDSADAAVLSDIQVLDDIPGEGGLAIEDDGELDLEFEVPEDSCGESEMELELGILDVDIDLDSPATLSPSAPVVDLPPPPSFS
jgi:hypothetical protein